ncbi:MAG: uracil-DNA glycosylase [Christensenellales bacterium]|jgi:uracil-DNA glycosylase family 4
MTQKRTHTKGPLRAFCPSDAGRQSLQRMYDECRAWLTRLAGCEGAPLGEFQRPVFGAGNPKAGIMLIGEAPGKDETEQGVPFVGKAGKTLSAFLKAVGFSRDALFITNAVKYRPFRLNSKGGKANRTPSRAELNALRELLLCEIAAVSPKIVVTLGNSPLYALVGRADIGACHGMPEQLTSGVTLFPLYHPASLIYNPALATAYEEDMASLRDYAARHQF